MKVSTYRQEPIEERKGIPDSFLEIEVRAPQTHGKSLHFFLIFSHKLTCTSNVCRFRL